MNKARFNLKNKADKESLISLIYRSGGERILYSTGMKVPPKYWNDNSMRVRTTQEYLDFDYINKQLTRIETASTEIIRKAQAEGTYLTQMAFKNEMDEVLKGKTRQGGSKDFTSFFNEFIHERSESPKYSPGSIEVYNTARKHIFKYAKGRAIKFEDLTLEFLKTFKNYLFKQDFADNHVSKIFSTLRTVLNEATERGLNKNMAYKNRKITVPKTETDNIYLTIDDLKKILELNLSSRPALDRVKDLFLIGAFTGLRFSDFTSLSPGNFQDIQGTKVVNVLTIKTKDRLVIPIHPVVENILKKYDYDLPEPISNQKMNDALKEIGELAGINEGVSKRIYRGGKVSELSFSKWELISSHTARRSFATNTYKAGVPMLSIMRITGHKKTETFMKYIKIDNEENALLMAEHAFFKA